MARGSRSASLAERWLSTVGHYRLSGYWCPYRTVQTGSTARGDQFTASTCFDTVVGLYEFDRRLKLALLDAFERIEIAVSFQVGHTLGRRGAYAHVSPSNLDGSFTTAKPPEVPSRYANWLAKALAAQTKSHEDFVVHFRSKYDGRLPVWVVTEILDFGGLSVLYQGLKRPDRDEIALK